MTQALAIVSIEALEALAMVLDSHGATASAHYVGTVIKNAIPLPEDGQGGEKWRRTIELLFRSGPPPA